MAYIKFDKVSKEYKTGNITIKALNNASFEIEKGELVVIVGPSGAGKTTALNILGGMDFVTRGTVLIDEKDISTYTRTDLTEYRRDDIGFVFQFYNLVQNLTAKENVELATQISKNPLNVDKVLDSVGLKDRKNNFPSQLSGGEQQRVANYKTGKQILKLLQDTCRKNGMTVIIITHNGAIAPMADKVIHFKNGTAEKIVINKNPKPVEEIEW